MIKTIVVNDRRDKNGNWLYTWYEEDNQEKKRFIARSAVIWNDVNRRCKQNDKNAKKWPTYANVSCEFYDFQEFAGWANSAIGYNCHDEKGRIYQLDKDILSIEIKSYSPDTCCFVPSRINTILISCSGARGIHPIGVHWCSRDKKFISQIRIIDKRIRLGYFNSAMDAHRMWQLEKSRSIRNVVDWYSNMPGFNVRVAEELLRRSLKIDESIKNGQETTYI